MSQLMDGCTCGWPSPVSSRSGKPVCVCVCVCVLCLAEGHLFCNHCSCIDLHTRPAYLCGLLTRLAYLRSLHTRPAYTACLPTRPAYTACLHSLLTQPAAFAACLHGLLTFADWSVSPFTHMSTRMSTWASMTCSEGASVHA